VFIWIGNERHSSVFFLLIRAGSVLQPIYKNFVLQLQAVFHRQCQQPETEVSNIRPGRSGWLYNPISRWQDKEVGKYHVACVIQYQPWNQLDYCVYCTIVSTASNIIHVIGFPPGIWRNTMMPTEILSSSSNRSLLHHRLQFINSRPCHHGLLWLRLLLGPAPAISRYHLVNNSRSVAF
jgi:hypothetical protein